ncbi:lipoyl(octanoyl) transferase LipB [Rhizosaccharibacter radicis]|uniref:Octanoyltransferase n=1 Tax=Rhizosaccharibacter radicis TaxID=2782605 RepID=A0ABT1VWH6_9PROT|nr:lipoyl(octanoyl) transferase LipB [Acetobacteraceae bacterium KSS12]
MTRLPPSSPARGGAVSWTRSDSPVPYPDAVRAMADRVSAIRAGAAPEAVWLLEHPSCFTAGTSARAADLFNPLGFPTFDAGRGGQWTYHGPGQRVAYVMLDLQQDHGTLGTRDVRGFVCALEGWLIDTLASFGIKGERRQDRIGVWVADPVTGTENKIAALGVRMTRWVSWHGVSINLDPVLAHFDGIVPCGIREHGVTSLRALGRDTTMEALDEALIEAWGRRFGGRPATIAERAADQLLGGTNKEGSSASPSC